MDFVLPEPWRLGRTQNGKRLLSYGDTWVEHITVDDSFQQSVKNAVENPGARAYVPMFKNGAFNSDKMHDKHGLMNLVKAELLNPMQAYELLPELKSWLKRNDLWKEPESKYPQVQFNNCTYEQRGRDWFCINPKSHELELVQKATSFQSVYQARLAFARGEATIEQIIEYGWGAFLEVIGDQSAALTDLEQVRYTSWDGTVKEYLEANTSPYKEQTHRLIESMLDKPARVVGFRYHKLSNRYESIYNIVPLRTNPEKLHQLHTLVDRVIDYEVSGRYARLTFINAFYKELAYEEKRWARSCHNNRPQQYSPYLESYRKDIAQLSLPEAAAYVQRGQQELILLRIAEPDKKKTTFEHEDNVYCLDIDSGKIHFMSNDCCNYIPNRFHKWSDERKHEFLGVDYNRCVREWEKRAAACARLKSYLHFCKGLSWKRADEVAGRKHRKLAREFNQKQLSAARWNCYLANRHAIKWERQLEVSLWEVA